MSGLIGYTEDYDPTRGWDQQEWDKYHLEVAKFDAVEYVIESYLETVQDLIDTMVREGYSDDLARRAALYCLDDGLIVIDRDQGCLVKG